MEQMLGGQMSLGLALQDEAQFDNFVVADEQQPWLDLLGDCRRWQDPIFLVTAPGFGCSHLLQASCHAAQQQGLAVQYLALADLFAIEGLPAEEVFEGLEQLDLLVLDDVHLLAQLPLWQEALFHLYNRITASRCSLLMGSHCLASQLDLQLKDLQSRLTWGLSLSLPNLGDEALAQLLIKRADGRGIVLSLEVASFIVSRVERSPKALMALLAKLDQASLEDQRRMTIPFVKDYL